jgi:hypothetical protein
MQRELKGTGVEVLLMNLPPGAKAKSRFNVMLPAHATIMVKPDTPQYEVLRISA